MPRVGVVGGTGFAALLPGAEPVLVETPFGDVPVAHARRDGVDLFALNRHGSPAAPAHRVNHKANVDALARCKVDAILALNSVGALHTGLASGSLLVPDDYLDLRPRASFFDDAPVHVDVSEAYCPDLRALLLDAARSEGSTPHERGTYVATDGPRLETRAEVRMMRQLGGDVVGMTGCPEAALARERALCYASLCLVTNPAAGVGGARPAASQIRAEAAKLSDLAARVALRAATSVRTPRACACPRALDEARL